MIAKSAADLVPTGRAWRRSLSSGTSGTFEFGPYSISWERDVPRDPHQATQATFNVHSPTLLTASCTIGSAQPRTTELARGLPARLGDTALQIKRNGPRPLRCLRVITIRGGHVRWAIPGSWFGTPPVEDEQGSLLWTPARRGQVRSGLSNEEAALLVALVATGIPQTTSIANALSFL